MVKQSNILRQHSFEWFFNNLPRDARIRIANRRIQELDLDIAWVQAMDVNTEDSWYLYREEDLIEKRYRWKEVRDRLVWDNEEVTLDT